MTPAEQSRCRVASWLSSLPAYRLEALASEFSEGVARAGLSVYSSELDCAQPLSAALTPEPFDEADFDTLRERGHDLLSAAVKLARWSLESPEATAIRRRLYSGFTALERTSLQADPSRLAQIATARLDLFRDVSGRPRVLEINATIPAMQGYSDILSAAWVRHVGRARGLGEREIEELIARVGSNSEDLLDALVAQYRAGEGEADRPSILIVSRAGDAQLSELEHYAGVFSARGHRALHVTADEIELDGSGRVCARGQRFDLIYRHIFARRVPADSVLAQLLVDPGSNLVLNPVLSPIETKGLLALLHETGGSPERAAARGLDELERAAVAELVPWTRVLEAAPATLADGSRAVDLARWVAEHPADVVLKRSWDYGGRSVLLGAEHDSSDSRERMSRIFGLDCGSWRDFARRAAADPDAWVVQEFVPSAKRAHLIVERAASGRAQPVWREVHADLSLYASLGSGRRPRGGVSRVSAQPIVNILGGGGLAPFLPRTTVDALFPPALSSAIELPRLRSAG